MKKIILEIIATFVVVLGVFAGGSLIKNSVKAVDIYKVTEQSVEDIVICSGKIEYKESCAVTPPTAGIITDVVVKKGDMVNKDDVLFTMVTDLSSEGLPQINNSLTEMVDNKTISIKAPVSGTILNIEAMVDDTVTSLKEIATIVNSKDLCVSLPVSESKIAQLKTGQPVKITGSAMGESTYEGVISEIDNIAQQVVSTTGKETAVDVVVDILNADEAIKKGYTAKCAITTNRKENSCIVPYNAIEMINEDKGNVYLYNNGKAVKKSVSVGNEYKDGVEVLSGLKNNDYIIAISDNISTSDTVRVNRLVNSVNG